MTSSYSAGSGAYALPDSADVTRIATPSAEVGVTKFPSGASVLIVQTAAATVLAHLTEDEARQLADALTGRRA
jgi:hypothetical protein